MVAILVTGHRKADIFMFWNRNKIAWLMFHSVVDESAYNRFDGIGPDVHMRMDEFEKIIRIIHDKHNPVSIEDATKKKLKKHSIVITFDDGYKNNIEIVKPIIEKYKIPITIYVTTGFIDGSDYPYEQLLASIIKKNRYLKIYLEGDTVTLPIINYEEKVTVYGQIREKLKCKSSKDRNTLLSRLIRTYGPNREIEFLSLDDLIACKKSPFITIGSHSHHHQVLSSISNSDALNDIQMGKRKLEEWLNVTIEHFAYPYGAYNRNVIQIMKVLKFYSAVTTNQYAVRSKINKLYEIPRFEVKCLNDFKSAMNEL